MEIKELFPLSFVIYSYVLIYLIKKKRIREYLALPNMAWLKFGSRRL